LSVRRTFCTLQAVRRHTHPLSTPPPNTERFSLPLHDALPISESKPGFGPDAVRYWAASANLGADTAYDVTQMQIGRRLAKKLLNASKFALALGVHDGLIGQLGAVTLDLDRAQLDKLS